MRLYREVFCRSETNHEREPRPQSLGGNTGCRVQIFEPFYYDGMRKLMELLGDVPVLDFNRPGDQSAFIAAVDAALGKGNRE